MSIRLRRSKLWASCLFGFGLIASASGAMWSTAAAQEAAPPTGLLEATQLQVAPEAAAVLDRLAKTMGSVKSVEVTVEQRQVITQNGQTREQTVVSDVAAELPNKFRFLQNIEGQDVGQISDGTNAFMQVSPGAYLQTPAPATLAELVAESPLGSSGPILQLSVPTAFDRDTLLQGAERVEFVGAEKVGDVATDRIRIVTPQMDWDLWIGSADQALPLKASLDISKQLAGNPRAAGVKVENEITFKDWKVDQTISADRFTFTPAADAKKFESLEKFRNFLSGGNQGPHPLLGKEAPEFDGKLADGEVMNLARHRGKNIVILDFWATWCGPCVMAMPVIEKVTGEFADRGVVLYAVNCAEDLETVQQFLKEKEPNLTVAMDPEGAISQKFGANAIPQTVIIDANGKVQVVHVGFSEDLEKTLRGELEALLEGRDLADETLKEFAAEEASE
jgi:peroxiredoxin